MKSQQSGFTLIELVIVIVLLGLLAATAAPRFANVQDSAIRGNLMGAQAAMMSSLGIAKAVGRTNTPIAADIIAQFDGNGDFTAAAAACAAAGATQVNYGVAAAAPAAPISITYASGGISYCVEMGYNVTTGVLSKQNI